MIIIMTYCFVQENRILYICFLIPISLSCYLEKTTLASKVGNNQPLSPTWQNLLCEHRDLSYQTKMKLKTLNQTRQMSGTGNLWEGGTGNTQVPSQLGLQKGRRCTKIVFLQSGLLHFEQIKDNIVTLTFERWEYKF